MEICSSTEAIFLVTSAAKPKRDFRNQTSRREFPRQLYIFRDLRLQFVDAFELHFFANSGQDLEVHPFAVDVTFEVEEVSFDRDVPCIERWPPADVRGARKRSSRDARAGYVYAQARQGAVCATEMFAVEKPMVRPRSKPRTTGHQCDMPAEQCVTRSMSPSANAFRTAVTVALVVVHDGLDLDKVESSLSAELSHSLGGILRRARPNAASGRAPESHAQPIDDELASSSHSISETSPVNVSGITQSAPESRISSTGLRESEVARSNFRPEDRNRVWMQRHDARRKGALLRFVT